MIYSSVILQLAFNTSTFIGSKVQNDICSTDQFYLAISCTVNEHCMINKSFRSMWVILRKYDSLHMNGTLPTKSVVKLIRLYGQKLSQSIFNNTNPFCLSICFYVRPSDFFAAYSCYLICVGNSQKQDS